MLNIRTKKEKDVKYIFLEGELDTISSQELEKQLSELLSDTDNVILDLGGLDYITSAGLRILLEIQKSLSGKGTMKIANASDVIIEIFEVTGFTEVLTII